jgi:hypothetical protein
MDDGWADIHDWMADMWQEQGMAFNWIGPETQTKWAVHSLHHATLADYYRSTYAQDAGAVQAQRLEG